MKRGKTRLLLIRSGIQEVFIEYLLYAKHCARFRGMQSIIPALIELNSSLGKTGFLQVIHLLNN